MSRSEPKGPGPLSAPATLARPAELEARARAVAALDAILWPDEGERTHLWSPHFGGGAAVFEARHAEGDHLHVWLSSRHGGGVVRGFAHESPMSPWAAGRSRRVWPGMWDGLPRKLAAARREPAFGGDEVTFAYWCDPDDGRGWVGGVTERPRGRDPDGARALLSILDGDPRTYARWASAQLGRTVPGRAAQRLYAGHPVDEPTLRALDASADREAVAQALAELGWPIALGNARRVGRKAPAVCDAEYKIARDGGKTLLIVGGRIQAEGPGARYQELLDLARKRLRPGP